MWQRGDSSSRPEGRQAAVIDVGSNSVRLVIYRVDGRALWTVYNEKVVAGLGKDLTGSGRLSPDGVEAAVGALRRFRAVLDGWKAEEVTTAPPPRSVTPPTAGRSWPGSRARPA
jgi:exopolyphosphatase/guanosine-5'-triphosphate,3'-diphosphate pyrophosphatase